jgi:hypothetical protein
MDFLSALPAAKESSQLSQILTAWASKSSPIIYLLDDLNRN